MVADDGCKGDPAPEGVKPCPFCAGDVTIEVKHSKITGLQDRYFPSCLDGDCVGFIVDPYATYSTKREAIATWNRRADPLAAQAPAMLEALREAHDVMHECTAVLTANDCATVAAAMAKIRTLLSQIEGARHG